MWDQIRKNKTRSLLLLATLAALLCGLGALSGAAFGGYLGADPAGCAFVGVGVGLLIFLALLYYALGAGARHVLRAVNARQIEKQDLPQLFNVVEEMQIAAGLNQMPAIYLIDDNNPNAFAVGQSAEQSAVAVTWGLLRRLNRDELQGVIAHEIGHIKNRDVVFLTIAATTAGAIVMFCEGLLRILWHSRGGGGRRSGGKGGGAGGAHLALLALLVLAAILAPLAAQLLYFACSRKREFLADASAARFTRLPGALAAALEKIAGVTIPPKKSELNKVVLPMYIVNPLQLRGASGWYSTHPPTEKRVAVLRGMSGAGFADYESAYQKIYGSSSSCIGAETLGSDAGLGAADGLAARGAGASAPIDIPENELLKGEMLSGGPARATLPGGGLLDGLAGGEASGAAGALAGAALDPETRMIAEVLAETRQALDLLDRDAGNRVIACPCGVRIKLPPAFQRESVNCARCGREHQTRAAQEPSQARSKTVIPRKRSGWQTVRCECGRRISISPEFIAAHVACPGCKRSTEVDYE